MHASCATASVAASKDLIRWSVVVTFPFNQGLPSGTEGKESRSETRQKRRPLRQISSESRLLMGMGVQLANAKVLVAGGSGFIGSNLIERLLGERAEIRATVHKNDAVIRDRRIEYVRADLTRSEDCRKVVKGVDLVFMCAASTSGAATIASNPLVHVTPNVVMNTRMLEAAYLAGVGKFVWISSSVGYPPSDDRPVREEEFFDGDPYETYFASGWMKRYTEILCRLYSEKLERAMPTVVVRPSNIYGPRDKFDEETSHVTAALVRKVAERQDPLVVWGTGDDIRDVIYIDDFVEALVKASERVDTYDPINVACGRGFSLKEILRNLLEIEGYTDARVVYDKSKPSMIPVRQIDVGKARSLLGFEPKIGLKVGLSRTMDWYKKQKRRRPR